MRNGLAVQRSCPAGRLVLTLVLLPSLAVAGEWPQWRGPRRDGSVAAPFFEPPPTRLVRVWEREVGGGHSGPVVSGDRVWVHSRQRGREVVRGLRLGDGELLWERSYEAPFEQDETARAHGEGPYATPAVAGGRLFTFGVNSVLSAWHADTGELLWRRESGAEFEPAFPFFGAAASPLVWRDLCFVHLGGHERDDIETPAEGAMVALRVADGHELWRWSGDGPAMGASPVIGEIDGHPQLVFKTKKLLVGLDPLSGKELWRIPFRVPMDNTIVTPILLGARLITSDWDMGMNAWEIRRSGEAWSLERVWRHREVSLAMSSPVLARGLLVGFSGFQRGQLFVLDPEDGRVVWRGAPRAGEYATLISWGARVLVAGEDGMLLLAQVSRDGLEPIGRYPLGRWAAWSHPAIAGDRVVFRAGTRLAASRWVRR